MLGSVVGDIIGSRFEWDRIKTKDFDLFTPKCEATDDSVMTLAVAQALLDAQGDIQALPALATARMREIGRHYPGCGYGSMFGEWIFSNEMWPYHSFGNGAAMRVAPCAFAARNLGEAKRMARAVTANTHDHPEGLKGAEATVVCVRMAKTGKSIRAIRDHVHKNYYPMDFTLDEIRPAYRFDETCQGTVPQAIMAFLESTGFEDCIRNAVSLGGDADTLAAIAGGIAGAHYGIPPDILRQALGFLDARLMEIVTNFTAAHP